MTREQREKGVIAASAGCRVHRETLLAHDGLCAGNHALALAMHGRALGIPVTVVMPTSAPLTKISNCREVRWGRVRVAVLGAPHVAAGYRLGQK
jgi:threonine dehydratase